MILTPGQFLAEEIAAARPRLTRIVRPIFVADDCGRPELIGSCTLIRVGSAPLLVTAAHLAAHFAERQPYIGGDNITPFDGASIETTTHAIETYHLDFKIVRLNDELASDLGQAEFVAMDAIDDRDCNRPGYIQCVAGYPLSRNKLHRTFDLDQHRGKLEPLVLGTTLDRAFDYARAKVSAETHIPIRFDPKQLADPYNEGKRIAPRPIGMSGGGLFYTPVEVDLSNMRLSALLIEYRKPQRAMLGVRMSYIMRAIDRWFPGIR